MNKEIENLLQIYRDELSEITAFTAESKHTDEETLREVRKLKILITALEAQQADMWIPIKDFEDIPKNNGFYIFQTKGKKIHEWWFEDGKIYVDNIHDQEYLFKAEDMAAWMPLPGPWKEEQP